MAPSRDDVLSNLSFFFGEPVSPEKLKDYSEQHATTFHFPDACERQRRAPPLPPPMFFAPSHSAP